MLAALDSVEHESSNEMSTALFHQAMKLRSSVISTEHDSLLFPTLCTLLKYNTSHSNQDLFYFNPCFSELSRNITFAKQQRLCFMLQTLGGRMSVNGMKYVRGSARGAV